MDDATFAAAVTEEWQAQIDGARSSGSRDEHSRAMSRLIETAAAEPVLRVLFPWTSMACLSVSHSADWRVWGSEGIPGIVAWGTGFTVLERHGRDVAVLLETDDPAEAVAYLVGWLREHRT
ncbi:DUF6193 family natural product biosynthesis protein [Kitasatospora sp. NPDC101157]|uniref:DUF6193 family natural product biosynthesis protein n=1 Tax=Kitasatospora sp. NPDC101157 TaxID=3364098 RepID=UPI0037FF43F4